jgi:hypothetical protein
MPQVMIFNATDGIYAWPEPVNREDAERFIEQLRAQFARQGYYKTASGERIAPEAGRISA